MYKLLLAGLLAVSSFSYASTGAPKAKKGKAKANTSCSKPCASTASASCKPGCLPSPNCPMLLK